MEENQIIENVEPKLSLYKNLFKIWIPLLSVLSVAASFCYIFFVPTILPYFGSVFTVPTKSFVDKIVAPLSLMSYGFEDQNYLGLIVAIAAIGGLFIEVYLLIRIFRYIKKQKKFIKGIFHLFAAQVIVCTAALFFGILAMFGSFTVSSVIAYADLKIHLNTSSLISDGDGIIDAIQKSSERVEVYDSVGVNGTVLANKDIRREHNLTFYESTILPFTAHFFRSDKDTKSYFVPQTNSFIYGDFTPGETDKIIAAIDFNNFKYSSNSYIRDAFQSKVPPQVGYFADDKYTPYVKQKSVEINKRFEDDLLSTLASNEKDLASCPKLISDNNVLISSQEKDYQQNCVAQVNYSDCSTLKNTIESNKKINEDSKVNCTQNKVIIDSQRADLDKLKEEEAEQAEDKLQNKKNELSNGMYFSDTKDVVMRIIPGQAAFTYLETLFHELLHHYSDTQERIPVFVDEGITDYLNYKNFGLTDEEMASDSITGYALETQIVMALLEKIPENELWDAYFHSTPDSFKTLFKKYFPNSDYDSFLSKGNQIFNETFQASDPAFKLGALDTSVDHPAVRDIRTLLGLDANKFYK